MFVPHYVACVICHVSCVTCHVSPIHITCHLSHVKKKKIIFHMKYMFFFFSYFFLSFSKKNRKSGGPSCWRVCYQQGLSRLFIFLLHTDFPVAKLTLTSIYVTGRSSAATSSEYILWSLRPQGWFLTC